MCSYRMRNENRSRLARSKVIHPQAFWYSAVASYLYEIAISHTTLE